MSHCRSRVGGWILPCSAVVLLFTGACCSQSARPPYTWTSQLQSCDDLVSIRATLHTPSPATREMWERQHAGNQAIMDALRAGSGKPDAEGKEETPLSAELLQAVEDVVSTQAVSWPEWPMVITIYALRRDTTPTDAIVICRHRTVAVEAAFLVHSEGSISPADLLALVRPYADEVHERLTHACASHPPLDASIFTESGEARHPEWLYKPGEEIPFLEQH